MFLQHFEKLFKYIPGDLKEPSVFYTLQVRVVNGVPPTGDYSFAKYNKVYRSMLLSSYMLCHKDISPVTLNI